MTTVRIMLAPREVVRDIYIEQLSERIELVVKHLPAYLILPPMRIAVSPENAADEIFDLTNNPSRQEERMTLYGNGRSLSVGDIVDVEGTKYLCCSIGWQIIK